MKRYVFLRKATYAPLADREYPEGYAGDLADWKAEHIASAIKTGLIRETSPDIESDIDEEGDNG